MIMERSEKAKKLREQRKFGKKVGVFNLINNVANVKVSWKGRYFDFIVDDILYYLCIKINSRFPIFYQVQIQVIQKRQKEKKAMITAVKKYQKGKLCGFFFCIWKKHKPKTIYLCVINLNLRVCGYVIYDLCCPHI